MGVGTISEINALDSANYIGDALLVIQQISEKGKQKPQNGNAEKCKFEFSDPIETILDVKAYQASISDFTHLREPPGVKLVKRAAKGHGINSQLSILKLDPTGITGLVKFPSDGFLYESC